VILQIAKLIYYYIFFQAEIVCDLWIGKLCKTLFSPVENVHLLPILLVPAHHVALRHLVPTVRPGILP